MSVVHGGKFVETETAVRDALRNVDVDEVLQAADTLEARLTPHTQHTPQPGWDDINSRLDDVMRQRLHELFGVII